MRLTPPRALALCLLFVHATAGCSSETEEPTDVSDAGYLPTGTYSLAITAASCSVNSQFQSAENVALIRTPTSANIPIPTPTPSSSPRNFDMPRQDVDLAKRHAEVATNDEASVGEVTMTLDLVEVSAKHLAIVYREASGGTERCSVEYLLSLVEAACPRDCASNGATLNVGPSRSMSWQCECK